MASFTLSHTAITTASDSWASPQSLNVGRYNGLKACQMPKLKARAIVIRHSSTRPLSISCASKTLEKVQEIIASQLSVDLAIVKPESKFSDLGADSLDTVEIVMSLEENFGVSIDEQAAENISTVQQVADLIEKQKVAS